MNGSTALPPHEITLGINSAGAGQHGLASLVSDRAVLVTQNASGDIVAQIVDTRSPGQHLVGDRVDLNGNGTIDEVDARPDLIVGTIGNDLIVADRGDTERSRSDDDTVHGALGNDTLYGGGSNDILDGGEGNDVAAYRGSQDRYSITLNGDGSYTVKDMRLQNRDRDPGPDGQDIITDIEQLAFGASIGTVLGTGGALDISNAVRVSTELFAQILPPAQHSVPEGTPQPWGLSSTDGFTVNAPAANAFPDSYTGAQAAPIAVAMENSFSFVWQSGNNVYLKAYDPLGRHDTAFGGAAQVFRLSIDPEDSVTEQVSGLEAAMAGDLGVVAVWQESDGAGGASVIKGRLSSAVGGVTGAGEFQADAPAAGRSQRDAAVVGYEIVDAANDTIEFGFNLVYTEASGTGSSGRILLDRFVIPVDATGLEQAPVSRPVNGTDTGQFVIAENGRNADITVLHDGEMIVSYVDGTDLKVAVLTTVTDASGNTTFENMVTTGSLGTVPAGVKPQVASLTTAFLVAYTDASGAIRAHVMAPGGGGWTITASIAPIPLPAGATGVFQISPTAEDDFGTGFAIYYEVGGGAGTSSIRGQVYGYDAKPIGGTFNVFNEGSTPSASGFSAAGLGDGRLVIAAAGQAVDGLDTDGAVIAKVLDTRVPGEQIIGPREGAPNDLLIGTAGNDAIDGREGEDEAHGGLGDDVVIGGSENDALFGEAGNDTLIGGSENDLLDGGDGNDLLLGGFGADSMDGGNGTDTISYQGEFARFSINLLNGITSSTRNPATGAAIALAIEDVFTGIENATGGEANDTMTGNALDNVLDGRAGNDVIDGGDGRDVLAGGDGADTLSGGAGDDTLSGGMGNDSILGGDGTGDEVMFSGTRAAYRVTYNRTTLAFTIEHMNGGEDGTDIIQGVEWFHFQGERVSATQLANNPTPPPPAEGIIVRGTANADTLRGSIGNDELLGLGGNDSLMGMAGDDTIDGGAGDDTLDGAGGNDLLVGGAGFDLLLGGAGNDILDGGGGLDTLNGGAGADTLNGGFGTDVLNGEAGNDLLDGGAGADTMSGGLGNDIFLVDHIGDVLIELAGEGIDTVRSSVGFVLTEGNNIENLELVEGEAGAPSLDLNGTGNSLANRISGNNGNNFLQGLNGNDTLVGNGGNDTLDGGAGIDRMEGGLGDDFYIVDNVSDQVVEALNQGTDTIRVTISGTVTVTLSNTIEHLILAGNSNLSGTGNALDNSITGNAAANTLLGLGGADTIDGAGGADSLDGGAGNDSLMGGNGADTILGGIGNDTIEGGAGADRLTGGAGADVFVYNLLTDSRAGAAGRDTITDFERGIDKIDLRGIALVGDADGDFTFIGNALPPGNGQATVRYITGSNLVSIDIGDGGTAEMTIQLNAGSALTQNDFLF
nr:calcium-binding protein [Pararoseomonas baculiformis]